MGKTTLYTARGECIHPAAAHAACGRRGPAGAAVPGRGMAKAWHGEGMAWHGMAKAWRRGAARGGHASLNFNLKRAHESCGPCIAMLQVQIAVTQLPPLLVQEEGNCVQPELQSKLFAAALVLSFGCLPSAGCNCEQYSNAATLVSRGPTRTATQSQLLVIRRFVHCAIILLLSDSRPGSSQLGAIKFQIQINTDVTLCDSSASGSSSQITKFGACKGYKQAWHPLVCKGSAHSTWRAAHNKKQLVVSLGW